MGDAPETTQRWWRKRSLITVPGLLLLIFSLPEHQENFEAWKGLFSSVGKSTWQVLAGYAAVLCFALFVVLEVRARFPVWARAIRQSGERFVILLGQGMELGRSRRGVRDEIGPRPLPPPTRVDRAIHDDENWITVSSLWPRLIESRHVATLVALNGATFDPTLGSVEPYETADTLIKRFSKEHSGSAYRDGAVHRDTWNKWLRDLVKTKLEEESDG